MDERTREGFIEEWIVCKNESAASFPKETFAVGQKGKNHDKTFQKVGYLEEAKQKWASLSATRSASVSIIAFI